jgi:hypothetical protein
VFFEHNIFSADKISNDEHSEKMLFLYEGPRVSKITGQDLNPSSTSTKVINSCNMSYAILSKIFVTRGASKFVEAAFINRRL